MVGVLLSAMGYKRSKLLNRGKGAAVSGIALGVFAILASTAFFFVYFTKIDGGPEIIRDGIATHSTNTEFPPQDDFISTECEAAGSSARATINLENKSPGPSVYIVTVAWETQSGGTTEGVVQSKLIDPGDPVTLRLFAESSEAIADTCKVTTIERSGLGILATQ